MVITFIFLETGGEPDHELRQCIERCFGSFQNMQTQLSAAAVGVQGSGWAWLGYDRNHNRLQIAACPNQDPLQATTGMFVCVVLVMIHLKSYFYKLFFRVCVVFFPF